MSSDRTKIHVTPDGNDWKVKKEGGDRASAIKDTKKEAVDRAIEIAKNDGGPAQVIIHKQDGTIQEERTYKDDPYPPKG